MDGWMGGWKEGWMDGWKEAKAGLRIAYSNHCWTDTELIHLVLSVELYCTALVQLILLICWTVLYSSSSVDLSRAPGSSGGLRRSASICDIRPVTETSNVYYATVSSKKIINTYNGFLSLFLRNISKTYKSDQYKYKMFPFLYNF